VAWHDARNDDGGVDDLANTETELYMALWLHGEAGFQPGVRVSGAPSLPTDQQNSHGDYLGLAFHGGVAHPAWVDNSDFTLDNPDADGCLPPCPPEEPDCDRGPPCMDPYVATVPEPGGAVQWLAGITALLALGWRRRRSPGPGARGAIRAAGAPTGARRRGR